MLVIYPPQGRWQEEKRYVARWVFESVLGFDVRFADPEGPDWILQCESARLSFPNLFFPENDVSLYLRPQMLSQLRVQWLHESLLGMDAGVWCDSKLPVFWAKDSVQSANDVDWLGSIFFLLTRFEEVVQKDQDEHQRFPISASVLKNNEWSMRPIADEYVETLWQCLRVAVPQLKRKTQKYQFFLSHDVDVLTQWDGAGVGLLAKRMAGDLLKRRSLERASKRWKSFFDPIHDETYCFDWIMEQSDARGVKSSFYFVANGDHFLDPKYDIESEWIRGLFKKIRDRGHEIGIHGSYLASVDAARFQSEVRLLEEISGVKVRGGRQHFLRFQVPKTWQVWEAAGLEYDASLGFAERSGFRCGTSREFPVFDLLSGKELSLRERPLIVMEHTLLSPAYEGLSHQQALSQIKTLAQRVRKYSGQMSLLWHNHNLMNEDQKQLYQEALNFCVRDLP